MSLKPGSRLGPYSVLGPLGAGGMGEVYRARDTKLERDVAIKVLPRDLQTDPDRRARFEREARLLATLNHPHIAAIYGLEDAGDAPALVLELVEGPTLADRLTSGPLAVHEALDVARQLAEALEEAHDNGVVHRDLKPANIKIRPDGTVKVLDFGLAKVLAGEDSGATVSRSATITAAPTRDGMLLGTAAYMSPEQARAQPVDKRTDIWAFGCVLVEMLTGRPVFAAGTIPDTLVNILEREPDWDALPWATPGGLRRLLKRCLDKEPRHRLRDIADASLDLDDAIAGRGDLVLPSRRSPIWMGVAAATALAIALVLAVATWAGRSQPQARGPLRLSIVAPRETTFVPRDITEHPQFALSPDGSRLAFVAARRGGPPQLWVRSLDSASARLLAGTEGASGPFWSPDSLALAFFARGKLKKLALDGATPQDLADVRIDVVAGTWNRAGTIVFAGPPGTELVRVSDQGGPVVPATKLDASRGEAGHQWPQFLPDGRRFIYYVRSTKPEFTGIYLASIDGDAPQQVLQSDTSAVFAESGHLLFEQNGNLMAQGLDQAQARLSGQPLTTGDRLVGLRGPAYLPLSVAGNGTLAYWEGHLTPTELLWFDRSGRPAGRVETTTRTDNPSLSPDGRSVLVTVRPTPTDSDVWRIDLATGVATRLTFSNRGRFSIWSFDASSVVFSTMDRLLQKPSSGAGEETVLIAPRYRAVFPDDWSRDGKWLVYGITGKTGWDVWAMQVATPTARPVLEPPGNQVQPRLSPDGRLLAYASDESGTWEVYVQPFPEGSGKWQVSSAGGSQPVWRDDGSELFYLDARGVLAAVPVRGVAPFQTGTPQFLFQTDVPPMLAPFRTSYAVSPDGQRFLLNNVKRDADPTTITLLLNWQAALSDARRSSE